MADWIEKIIEIGYNTDLWGPYSFQLPICSSAIANDGKIPYGDSIASVTVEAYPGNLKRTSDISEFTEMGAVLIDPAFVPVISGGDTIKIKLQYAGDDYKGTKITLVYKVTLASGGTRSFYFQYVKVC